MKNKLHILKSELPEDGQQLRPKGVGGLTNKSFVQQVGVKFHICLREVYVIKDNINAFNKTLNKPSKAVPPCWTPHYALLPQKQNTYALIYALLPQKTGLNIVPCSLSCSCSLNTVTFLHSFTIKQKLYVFNTVSVNESLLAQCGVW